MGVVTILTPFIINREGQFVAALALGAIYGVGIGVYFSLQISAYSQFVPHGKEATYMGLYNAFGYSIRWMPTLVYTSIAQVG